jgi:hypothetical protein
MEPKKRKALDPKKPLGKQRNKTTGGEEERDDERGNRNFPVVCMNELLLMAR